MSWDGTGGGHLYCSNLLSNDNISFTGPTTVNSFQMNALPYQGYGYVSNGYSMNIAAFDAGNNQVWSNTVNLAAYTNWANWLTVIVGTANVSSMTFYAPGYTNDIWPSIDNMVINEAVPVPGAAWLLGSGLLGLAG